ncbi:FlgD immunoglobulin-like domain containing protein [Gracilimonas sp.]|uniref:WD40/YVTN/BNR-like repeat-containing protein n=1 Tax=Gracilimonas sp. TaxID=1974203 RepID=UPI0032F09B83
MKKFLAVLTLLFIPLAGLSQVYGPLDPNQDNFNSIRVNGVSTILAYGDTVWISPSLNRNIGNVAEWFTPENADSVVSGIGRVYSLELGQDTVLAGLGFTNTDAESNPQTAYGYYFSIDGGDSWRFEPPVLDPDPPAKCFSTDPDYQRPATAEDYDPDCDIQFTYGGVTYNRIRFTVPEQAPPYEVDFKDNVVFSTNFAGGLLRSTDFGQTWERVILPPDNVSEMTPDDDYTWGSSLILASGNAVQINRYDPISSVGFNIRAFGVHIDTQNRVWVGTGNGINVSDNALSAPTDSIRWNHITYDGSANGLIGNWVIEIKEEPGTGKIWMTNRVIESGQENQGLVYTDDGGQTFEQMLIGERINDIGFKDGYVFATGDNGLFISPNGGDTWIKSPQIKSPNTFIKSSAIFYSATSTTDRVWVSTSDGLASHECCVTNQVFDNWQITRVDFPLDGGNIHEEGRNVNSYAYPNPFSPTVHELVRIKFEVDQQVNVKVRVFDFGMNLVREIENASFTPGTYEAIWDGIDGKGRKVANGPYIYVIQTGNKQTTGKILVVD